jgi:hypothetical protein
MHLLLAKEKNYQRELIDMHIEEVEAEIERLKSLIERYTSKIKSHESTKII